MAKLSTTAILRSAWQTVRPNTPVLAVLVAASYLIDLAGKGAFNRVYPIEVSGWLYPLLTAIQAILDSILFFMIIKVALALAAGRKVEPKDLPEMLRNLKAKQVVQFIVTSIIYGVAVAFGLIIFIVPGLYLMTKYGFYGLAIADKNVGIGESFQVSQKLTAGRQMELLPLYLLSVLTGLALGAVSPLLSGVSLVFFYLAFAKAYRTLGG